MKQLVLPFIFAAAFTFGTSAHAQTTDTGNPRSWLSKTALQNVIPVKLNKPDTDLLKAEDEINMANKVGPWRFGFGHEVETDVLSQGIWDYASGGGRTCRIVFASKDALTMNVFFHKFVLPEGATVHVYNKDRSVVDGAYTHANNQPDKMLSTFPIDGSEITIEYFEPAGAEGLGELVIGEVIHGYRPIRAFYDALAAEAKGLNDSGACNYDTGCSQQPGNPFGAPGYWDEQIASVAMMIRNGSGICSGTLINNTANDGTPYFLSANHCGTTNGGGLTFRFGWESPNPVCASTANSTNGPTTKIINGAVLRANRSGSDFALWQMNSTPPASYGVYYAGWDRSGVAPSEVTGIHHPRGDLMKICREADQPYTSTVSGAQVWWINNWEYGVTEPGSSGSAIFDQNKRIVGQLYGGLAACSGVNNNGSYDYYGRFDVSWNAGTTNSTRLSNWLDPLGSAPLVLDGYNPNAPTVSLDAGVVAIQQPSGSLCGDISFQPEVQIRNFGSQTLTTATITYGVNGGTQSTFAWSGSLTSNQLTTVILPVYTPAQGGALTFTATITNPNGGVDQNPANNSASTSFQAWEDGEQVNVSILLDCWGSETTWQISDNATQAIMASGGPYTNGTGGTTQSASVCLGEGCYTFTIFDSFGDGLAGAMYSCGINGNYSVTNAEGEVLVQMGPVNFGFEASHSFCIEASTPVTPPCTSPYPTVTGLVSQVNNNNVKLNWNGIPGSTGCDVQGGPADIAGQQTISVTGDAPSQLTVPGGQFPMSGVVYRWRVRCRCSQNPLIVGNYSPYAYFFWPGTASGISTLQGGGLTDVTFYPNPTAAIATGEFYGDAEGTAILEVFDLAGRRVIEERLTIAAGVSRFDVNLAAFGDGIYIARVQSGDAIFTRKIVLQR